MVLRGAHGKQDRRKSHPAAVNGLLRRPLWLARISATQDRHGSAHEESTLRRQNQPPLFFFTRDGPTPSSALNEEGPALSRAFCCPMLLGLSTCRTCSSRPPDPLRSRPDHGGC